ncbi:MAG: nucleotidyltransferase domain-containing protein [archaeon]
MLETLFTSKLRVKILYLLLNKDEKFSTTDLIKLLKKSRSHILKEINNLTKLNIVKAQKIGNSNIYSINKDCNIVQELRSIFIKTDYLKEDIIKELKDKAKYALIFGSFAKGNINKNSDIDLLIISDTLSEDSLIKKTQTIEKNIGREINSILWSTKKFRDNKNHYLLNDIYKNKIIMLVGDEHEFRNAIR